MRRGIGFLLVILLSLASLTPAMAQDQTAPILGVVNVLADGQPLEGSMSDADADTMHLYAFAGAANTTVTISMTRTDGSLDPLLILLGQDGSLIGWDDDSGGDLNAQLTATLPETDIYLVFASTLFALYQQGIQDINGSYSISISGAAAVLDKNDLDLTQMAIPSVGLDSSITAVIDEEHPVFLAWLTVQDSITVDLNSPSAEVDTLMYVFDVDGKRIAIDDDGGADGYSASIPSLPLTEAGQYLIVVTSFDYHNANESGLSGGTFDLIVSRSEY